MSFFLHPLCPYDKSKVNWLKAIFPIIIIVHHISNLGYTGFPGFIHSIDAIIMPLFFAMSGFGLVICYKNNEKYINGFLKRSLIKLFIPYLIALVSFVVYRELGGGKSDRIIKRKGDNVICSNLMVHLDIILFLYFFLYNIQIL